jgi:hypothetical protein
MIAHSLHKRRRLVRTNQSPTGNLGLAVAAASRIGVTAGIGRAVPVTNDKKGLNWKLETGVGSSGR